MNCKVINIDCEDGNGYGNSLGVNMKTKNQRLL